MIKKKVLLGVNIDHVATVRQARRGAEPDPVHAAVLAELAGADQITVHLREDRRHIGDRDVEILRKTVKTRLNLEMAVETEIIEIALRIRPDIVTFVPEKREEITTEGGLDVKGQLDKIRLAVERFQQAGIEVSLFIDPDSDQITSAYRTGARSVEFHTGKYAESRDERQQRIELQKLTDAAEEAANLGISVKAGHGLNYQNVKPVADIPQVEELNIGHSIVSRAVFTGLTEAVATMKKIMNE